MTGEEKTVMILLILFTVRLVKHLQINILQVYKEVDHSKGAGEKRGCDEFSLYLFGGVGRGEVIKFVYLF